MEERDQRNERVRDLEIVEPECCVQGQSLMFFIHVFVIKTFYNYVLLTLLKWPCFNGSLLIQC